MSARTRRRRLLLVAVTLTVCASAAACAAGSSPGRPAATRAFASVASSVDLEYVALGDSYTAGPLIPLVDFTSGACLRSTNNYPKILGRWLAAARTVDVSCSGAATSNMTQPQRTVFGSYAPQFDALTPATDLVTLGIGGNDFGLFGGIADTCRVLMRTDPTGAPCRNAFTVGGVDTKLRDAHRTGPRVAAVVRGIHQHAPHATVYVLGYPRIGQPHGVCRSHFFADGDVRWADRVERTLNRSIHRAAVRNGARYVDLYPSTFGHDACAGRQAWTNGPRTSPSRAIRFHPFFRGMFDDALQAYVRITGHRPSTADVRVAVQSERQGVALTKLSR